MPEVPAYALVGVLAAFAWATWRLLSIWRDPDRDIHEAGDADDWVVYDDVDAH